MLNIKQKIIFSNILVAVLAGGLIAVLAIGNEIDLFKS